MISRVLAGFKKYEKTIFAFTFWIMTLYVVVIFVFHEPWRDEAQAWLIARDNSFLGMISQMRYEGHPPTWFLMLFPISHLGLPFISMRILHVLIAISCFGVVCFKLKCNPLLKFTLIIATPLFYELSVTARNYTIGVLLILLLAVWYDRRFTTRKVHCAVGLFLLINSNIFAATVAIALVSGEAFLALYAKFIERKPAYEKREKRGAILFYLFSAIGFAVLFITIGTNIFAEYNRFFGNAGTVRAKWEAITIFESIRRVCDSLGGMLFGVKTLSWWVMIIIMGAICWGIIVFSQGKKKKLHSAWLVITGLIGQVAVIWLTHVEMVPPRYLAIVPFYLAAVWCINVRDGEKRGATKPMLAVVLLLMIGFSGVNSVKIIKSDIESGNPFSENLGKFLKYSGYDREDVLIIEDGAPFNAVAKAQLNKVRFFRSKYDGKAWDMSYAAWQIPGVIDKREDEEYAELLEFAEEQAQMYKDEYSSILYVHTVGEGGEKLPHELIYGAEVVDSDKVIKTQETSEVYLMAQDGVLF